VPETTGSPTPPVGPPGEGAAIRVLVAYASKYGSNREIAEAVGAVLVEGGVSAEVRAAAEVRSLDGYDAVILGSALYAATWLKDANRFVRTHREALAARPVWLFSSGPLDRSADFDDIPMTAHVVEAMTGVPIRGHRTFGGRLRADAPEVEAGIIATHRTGDFRDWDAIRAWASDIAAALH
jgi:menaquinone-dependent protoporphyrinogen oxidase